MQILGSKFWALVGLNQKSKKRFEVFVMENWWPKNGSIPSKNKKQAMFVTDRRTDGQTDRVNDKKNNRLLG